ncbi:unnamed protein product, partial [Staurois parvus]
MAELGTWQQLWEARNLPAPYDKKCKHTSSVRRPESGTWQSVAGGDRNNGRAPTGTHERLWPPQQH